jgi:hypothetical protein
LPDFLTGRTLFVMSVPLRHPNLLSIDLSAGELFRLRQAAEGQAHSLGHLIAQEPLVAYGLLQEQLAITRPGLAGNLPNPAVDSTLVSLSVDTPNRLRGRNYFTYGRRKHLFTFAVGPEVELAP